MTGLLFNLSETGSDGQLKDQQELLIPAEGYVAAAVTLFLIGICGFCLNLLVIVLMLRDKQLWTPLNVILLNLIVSDFLVSILGNPWTFTAAVYQNWIFGRALCIAYGFMMSLLGITSITTLTVLAFERYVIISQPLKNRYLSHKEAYILVLGIWLYSLALTLPPLFGWGGYVNESANISCSVNWEDQTNNTMTYIMYLFTFGLFVPVSVITFSYVNIILTLRKNAFKLGRVTKAEGKVATMVLVMVVAFIVAWSPYAILALIVQFGDASIVTPGVSVIPALLAKSSICYNPIIYVGLNTQFRNSGKQLLKIKRQRSNSMCETYAMKTTRYFMQDGENDDVEMSEVAKSENGIKIIASVDGDGMIEMNENHLQQHRDSEDVAQI